MAEKKIRFSEHTNLKCSEYAGDEVGRPEDEREIADERFQAFPEERIVLVPRIPVFPGDSAEKRSSNYWRRVRNTSSEDESSD